METATASIADRTVPFASFLAFDELFLGGGTPEAAEQVVVAKSGILAPATDEVAAAITAVVAAVAEGAEMPDGALETQGASEQDNSIISRSSDR